MLNRKEARKRLTAVMAAALLLGGTIFTGVCTPVVAESGRRVRR